MADQEDDISTLAAPTKLDRAMAASGTKDQQQPFMVAVDRTTGKAVNAWKGHARHTGRGYENVEQYPVTTTNLAAARRHGEILHQQHGRRQEGT